ncbi:hypothetical protein [Cobetia amphilecti]|uniref:HNH nuclease domain-containing protein n=1 Tax=Cobetia amphilecti TaxID=1055104 RepID=A0AAP4TVW6_9GAMM|nr:hypothetical protein [Cobetia amphilecti]MDO6671342.1 hypothetical protein [Cobetia amphilecti]
MKLEISFNTLKSNARPMARPGHRPLSLDTSLPPLPEREAPPARKPGKPLEVDLPDVGPIDWDDFEHIRGKGDLLEKQGQQVMLYMRGHYTPKFHQALFDGINGNRIHVAYCQKLEEMKRAGKLDSEYFFSQSLEGQFLIVDRITREQGMAALKVCKLCLRKLNYEGYLTPGRGTGKIFDEFTFQGFFEKYSSFFPFHPAIDDDKQVPERPSYTKDWPEVSRKLREQHHYTCSQCRVSLNAHRHLLHVHHVNAVKNDNRKENLRVLCIDCHSKQPNHQRMFVHHDDRKLIASLRRQQEMPISQSWVDVFRFADPGVHGLLHHLQHNRTTVPEVGLDIQDSQQMVVATLELAWPRRKIGVAIDETDVSAAEALGWQVLTVEQALNSSRSF